MKILVVGDWHSNIHEEPVYQALVTLGHTVERFAWHQYFTCASTQHLGLKLWQIPYKIQNKFLFGPLFRALNRDVYIKACQFQPDMVFVYRGTHITRNTLHAIKQRHKSTCLVGYNNDDPFAPHHPRWIWRHFLTAIPEYDLVLSYRQHNLEGFQRSGAKQVHLLRSWFAPEISHPVTLSPEDRLRFGCDVVFAGHYEPDQRLEFLEEVIKHGFHLRLFGPDYPKHIHSAYLRPFWPVQPVHGEDYNKALCGAKVALCFLSKLNRDTYTRRCFEIPATRTLMLSEYSDDLASLYREGIEAVLFHSKEEFMDKLHYYLTHDNDRQAVAEAGYRRVYADGHDVVSRVRQLMAWVTKWQQANT